MHSAPRRIPGAFSKFGRRGSSRRIAARTENRPPGLRPDPAGHARNGSGQPGVGVAPPYALPVYHRPAHHPRVTEDIVAALLPKPFLPHVLVRRAHEILGTHPRTMTATAAG